MNTMSKTIPSPLEITLTAPSPRMTSFIRTKRRRIAKRLKGISLKSVEFLTCMTYIVDAIPQMSKRFDIFEPIILAIRRSVSPLLPATRLTKSSGAEVQKAIIVSPTTNGGIRYFLAIAPPQLMRFSPHKTST